VSSSGSGDEERARLLEELRPRAFAVAYRMLGSVAQAEDVVQEALIRLNEVLDSGEAVSSPPAYLATVVTRLAIDELRSARARRETYVGEWLPEPLLTSDEADPAREAELSDSLSFAFLRLLESLSPEQRAVFLLHDVFDYPFAEIAGIVGRSEPATRQLAVRARARIDEGRPRYEVSREENDELASRFFAAADDGDLEALEQLLAADVELHGDGGGKVPALARPVVGREHAARTLVAWFRAGQRIGGISVRPARVNGMPGAITTDREGLIINAMVLEIGEGQVQRISSVVNPDKLHHLGPVADVAALLRASRDE
jgi:RNA polymerase sigma-70 factor (ECF subfamily)